MGVAGALMQGLTRNPLADPGILGVNAGASLFLVLGMSVLGVQSLLGLVWFSLFGAAVTSVAVFVLGTRGRGGTSPVTLTLAGAAVAGSYVRRLGAAALGGGGACSHGLDSGLPDLRKAM